MSFPRYPAYKDSGVEWLGEVPQHWPVKRFKYLFHLSDERNGLSPVGEMLSVSGYRGVEVKSYSDENQKRSTEELAEYRVVRQGQLAVNIMWLNYSGLGVSDLEGYVSPAYRVFNIHSSFNKKFVHLLLRSSIYVAGYTKHLQGIRPNSLQVPLEDLNSFPILIPPLPEQRAIAAFLDAETARIDALVAKQEALIATLQEKRRALISHAVTKGIDSAAPMRDSGVPWLGEVPAHWEVKPIKYLVHMESGGTPDKSNLEYWDGTIPWASAKDLKVDLLRDTEDHITQHAIDSGEASLIAEESVIIVVRGMILLHTLPVAVNLVPLAINQDLKGLHPIERLSSFFLAWSLRGLADAFLARTDTAGHGTKALRTEDWNDVELGLPPLDEQRTITNYIDQETAQIDTLIAKAEAFIELLREHRTALIAAAVTGQIDVRGYAEAS
jgi:type I restriction enzyme S subunit